MSRLFLPAFSRTLPLLLFLLAAPAVHAQLAVTEGIAIDSLVRNFFIGGGAQVTNIDYRGFPRSIGYFDGTASNIGIDEGVLMTTGWVGYAVGPNQLENAGYGALVPGDQDLAQLVGAWTFDACVLEFDFVPYQDTVHFEYVFGSEEYTEYVGSEFNDVFAFFITGPGIIGQRNIALIPGTSTPVAINTVNHIDSSRYYVNNFAGNTVQYDGFTTVLKASAAVIPCQTYHFKLAIADVSDNIYDSGVFLKAGSFDAGNQLAVVGLQDAAEGGCQPGIIEIQRLGHLGEALTVHFQLRGDADNGSDFAGILDSVTFAPGQSSVRIPIDAVKDSISDDGEWVTIYIPDICNTGLVKDSIRIREVPDLVLTAHADTTLCAGDALRFEARFSGGSGVFGYGWSGGAPDDRVLNLNPAMTGNYVFTVYDSLTGCEYSDTLFVNVEDPPVADAGPDKVVCPGGMTQLEATVTGDNPPYQVVWSPMNGLSNPGAVSPQASPMVTTVYVMTVTSRTGCVSVDSVTVRVSNVVVDAGKDSTICRASIVRIGGEAAGGVPPYTYRWEPAATLSNPGAPVVIARPLTSTTYRLTARSSNGCEAIDSVRITVADVQLDAGPDRQLCLGQSRTIGDTAVSTHHPVQYVWEPQEGLDNPFSPTPVATPERSTTYIVTATSAWGCVVRDTVEVRVNVLRIDAGPSQATCPGGSVQLSASVLSGAAPYEYRWAPAAGLNADDIPDPMATPAKSQWYVLTVIDREGCVQRDSMLVTVWPEPSVKVAVLGSPVLCVGDSVDLDAGGGHLSYLWSTGESARRIRVGRAGTYWVEVVSTDGCPAVSDTVEIMVTDKPAPRISGPTTLCAGEEGVYAVPMVTGAVYDWGVTGGRVLDGHGTPQLRVLWEVPGSYTVRIDQVFGSASCKGDTTISVTVLPNPDPVISADGPLRFCEGEAVVLRAPPGFASYRWSNGADTPSITVDSAGEFTVAVTTAGGCTGTSPPLTVVVSPLPAPEIIARTPHPVCEGGSVTLGLRGSYASYLWSDGSREATRTVTAPGSFSVRVSTAEGCSADAVPFAVRFLPVPDPVITADGPLEFCLGDSVRLRVTDGFARYLWTSGEETSAITVRESGTYAVRVWNADACEGTSNALTVIVHPLPVPPVITRDGDSLRSTPAVAYRWYEEIGGQRLPVADGATRSIPSLPDRRYWVSITDGNGCSAISDPFSWSQQLQPASTVSLPVLEANPGDPVVVDLSLLDAQQLTEAGVKTFSAELRFNASLLVPAGSTPAGRIENGERVIDLNGRYDDGGMLLRRLSFVATLGNAPSTPLTISAFSWDRPEVVITRIDGELRLGICREGGARLFESTGSLALEQNHPNPFNSMTVLTYEIIERGPTLLYVTDMLGRRVATLQEGVMEAGRYQVAFDARALSSGMYIAVLRTPTQLRMRQMKLIK
ncbi:MAG: choice-of-anchor L domain-containing protein [Bacteroidota bacterium]|nr:choice-of-anchor L domain-containing protein [Bacteroidota bacterium]